VSFPVITTIILTYHRPKLLARAINSVLSQTYPHIRICIYDNGNDKETFDVVTALMKKNKRIIYHRHDSNIGGAANIDYGMRRVDTEYFSFLSDDDVLLPTFYENSIYAFSLHSDAMFISSRVIAMTEMGSVVGRRPDYFPAGYYAPPKGIECLARYGPPTWTGILFRTDVINKLGLVDLDMGLISDYDYELKVAASYPYVVIDSPGAIFLVHDNSTSGRTVPILESPDGRLEMLRRIQHDYNLPEHVSKLSCQMIKRRHYKALLRYIFRCSRLGDFHEIDRAANILKHVHDKGLEACVYKIFLRLRFTIKLIYVCKRLFSKKSPINSDVQCTYGKYSKYLEFDN